MIIDLKKYLILGAKEDLDDFFDRAQQVGILEFISISGRKQLELPSDIQHLIAAHKVLRKQPVLPQAAIHGDLESAVHTAEKILSLKSATEKNYEEIRLLTAEVSRVKPFGDFSMEDIEDIERRGKRVVQFFCMKTEKTHKNHIPEEVVYINTDYDMDYFIAINPEPRSYPDMIEMRIDRPLGELQRQLSLVTESVQQGEAELKALADQIDFLHEALIERLNEHNLISVKKDASFPLDQSLFCIEAWVPMNKLSQLFSLINGMAIHTEEIPIEKDERVPTYMENKGAHKLGEDLVKVYDVPAHTDKDPSGWVICAFALFFAIIIADAGYGLLYLALAIFLKFKMPKIKGLGKRMLNLLFLLSATCIIWGVVNTAYFGLDLNPNGFLAKLSFTDYVAEKKADYILANKGEVYQEWLKKYPDLSTATSGEEMLEKAVKVVHGKTKYEMSDTFADNTLLELSLLIGVVHICLSLARHLFRNWANLGWIVFAIGGYLFFPSMLHATSMLNFLGILSPKVATAVGLQLIYGGIGVAVILALIQKRFGGIGEITQILQVFADILSYLRLYALALASTVMAETFNGIGSDVGLALGIFVILVGHGINIMLGTMSGVIHGLRLNFIEWYHYSFEGGGKLFAPLKKLKAK